MNLMKYVLNFIYINGLFYTIIIPKRKFPVFRIGLLYSSFITVKLYEQIKNNTASLHNCERTVSRPTPFYEKIVLLAVHSHGGLYNVLLLSLFSFHQFSK